VTSLFDDFGFVAVVLKGLGFVAQSVLIGATAFMVLAIPRGIRADSIAVLRKAPIVVKIAALATIVVALATMSSTACMLIATVDLRWRDVASAPFVLFAMAKVTAAIVIACSLSRNARSTWYARATGVAAAFALIAAIVVESHAIARVDHVALLSGATYAHRLGAAVWLGGLPCLWLALRETDPGTARAIGRRYSTIAAAGVVLIVGAAVVFAVEYIRSVDALYGTAYGAMAAVKTLLLVVLLAFGSANFRTLRGALPDRVAVRRVRRFVEVEIAAGFAVLMAAASITSAPAAVDVVADRVSWSELVARMAPATPSFETPAHGALSRIVVPAAVTVKRTDGDRGWSAYNHHVAGLVVLLIGFAALLRHRRALRWTEHWPLLILLLGAFLLLRADPEVWPLGSVGPLASLRDPEVLQHRLFVVLIAAFAIVEWRVQRGRTASARESRVFPLLMVAGGALLLTHWHAVANAKEQLLIELTHLPIAVLGVAAGSARWLELSISDAEGRIDREGRVARYVWPVALILVGLILLDYREA
jgi:putative copper resistance protein D